VWIQSLPKIVRFVAKDWNLSFYLLCLWKQCVLIFLCQYVQQYLVYP
jgi:hypothetical protein